MISRSTSSRSIVRGLVETLINEQNHLHMTAYNKEGPMKALLKTKASSTDEVNDRIKELQNHPTTKGKRIGVSVHNTNTGEVWNGGVSSHHRNEFPGFETVSDPVNKSVLNRAEQDL